MAARKLLGRTQPRLWTPPLRTLNRRTSLGYDVAEFADVIGEPLLPWQRWLAIHALELNPDGAPRFRVVLVMCGRQSGKSSVKRTISLFRLYVTGARLILGVAQDQGLAREQQHYCLETIENCAFLAEDLTQVRKAAGDEWFRVAGDLEYDDADGDESFTLGGGGRYKIAASNRKAGRGLSVDELNIDELREWHSFAPWSALYYTTMARPEAQIWCMSNAGDDRSIVLNQLRESALSGRDPSIGIFEWSAEEGSDLEDPQVWRQAIPGLGYTVSEAAIRTALTTDPPNVFRTEALCIKVDQLDGAIDYEAWKLLGDAQGSMDSRRDRLAACLDAAPDGEHFTLCIAAKLADGRPRIELVRDWTSAADVRKELSGVLAKVNPQAFGWFPIGPAAELGSVVRPLAIKINRHPGDRGDMEIPEDGAITGSRVSEACMEFSGLVRSRGLVHAGQELLDTHVRGASKLATGDGWRFTRHGEGHCDAVYAAAGSVLVLSGMPARKRPGIRFVA